MDEQRGLQLAGLAMTNEETLNVGLKIRETWLIVNALQLMVTHPGLHEPLRSISEEIGRALGARIVEVLPEVGELLEMGWHREADIEQDDGDAPFGWYDDVDDVDDHNDASDIPW